jgi:GTP-binding protein
MSAIIAIIGRPNVGKSTLFNRIIKQRKAIECNESGTTRDTVSEFVESEKVDYLLVDTGGLEFDIQSSTIEEDTQKQARIAIDQADVILFCINTQEPLTNNDELAANLLRAKQDRKPIFIIGTKADSGITEAQYPEIFSLGIKTENIFFTSSNQNSGIKQLKNSIENHLINEGYGKRYKREVGDKSPPRISFFGRPNAGKSSMINCLLKKEVCIVSEEEGTTRDSKDIEYRLNDKNYILVDTAGIRRKSKVNNVTEKFSVMRSMKAISESDVVIYLIDAEVGVNSIDQKLIGELKKLKPGVIIAVNKWDLKEQGEDSQKRFYNYLSKKIPFLPWAPVIYTSSNIKKNLLKFFPIVDDIVKERCKSLPTGELNSFLQEVISLHPPAGLKNKKPRFKYIVQKGINPPHLMVYGSKLDFLHWSYQRYFEHRLRDAYGFYGTGIDIEYKNGSSNPYDKDGGAKNWRAVKKGNFKEENL